MMTRISEVTRDLHGLIGWVKGDVMRRILTVEIFEPNSEVQW